MIYKKGKKWIMRCELCDNEIDSDYKKILQIESHIKGWVWFIPKLKYHIDKEAIKRAKKICCPNCKSKSDIYVLKEE